MERGSERERRVPDGVDIVEQVLREAGENGLEMQEAYREVVKRVTTPLEMEGSVWYLVEIGKAERVPGNAGRYRIKKETNEEG